MPSGRTHDRITLLCLPLLSLATFRLTASLGLTGLTALGFLFGGFMFGPDLDIRSLQSKRWGCLGWIWRPYRGHLRHRSWLSHGPIAGTFLRLAYLSIWLLLGLLFLLEIANASGRVAITWNTLGQSLGWALGQYPWAWGAIALGIELGAMSHTLSDWLISHWKRQRKSGVASATRAARAAPKRKRRRRR
jgi:uncharacterized metal-binding protein